MFPSANLLQEVMNIITGRNKKLKDLRLWKEKYSSFWNRLVISRRDSKVEVITYFWLLYWLPHLFWVSASSFLKFPTILIFKENNFKFLARWRWEEGRGALIREVASGMNYGVEGIVQNTLHEFLIESHTTTVECYYSFNRGENWSLERLNNLPKVTQPVTELGLEPKVSGFSMGILVCQNLLNTRRREILKEISYYI